MTYTFEAVIQKHPDKDATYIEIPFDVEEAFGAKRVKVKAKFDGIAYRGSIVKMGLPCYMLGITKEIRKQMGKEAGELVRVEVEKDEEERVVELPEDFRKALSKEKNAMAAYEALSYSAKRKMVQGIISAKKEETRQKRLMEAIDRLKSV